MQKILTISIALTMMVSLLVFNSTASGPNYEKQGLSIPEGYPEDLVPLMDGYKIVSGALGNKGDQQEVWLKYMVNTDIDQAAAFYKNILSKGNLQHADKMGKNLYMLKGELGGKTVGINITTEIMYDNYQSNVLITILGDLEVSKNTGAGTADVDSNKTNKNLKNIDKVPGDYPFDLVPLYGNELKYGDKSVYKGKDIFMVQIYSTEDKDEILAIYKEILKKATKKEEGTLSTGSHTFGGVMGNYKVSLLIGDMGIEGHEYKSFYTLQLDVLE